MMKALMIILLLVIPSIASASICNSKRGSTAVEPLVEPLRSKVKEIVAVCGSRVISTGCRGGVTPNHRQWKAADIQGNPSCIYDQLKGWPGGVSIDYKRVKHVHVSYNRKHEWGLRFAHSGASTIMSAKRKHRHHRYAYVQDFSFRQFPAH